MGKGRAPCCDKSQVKKGPWSPAEDLRLITFIQKHGHDNWRALPKLAGLARCGKSCRLRWINYLRPDVKRGNFTKEEEDAVINLHQTLGNKWSKIASYFPGRTDNEIKNIWNTHLKKRVPPQQQDSAGADESKDSSATYSSSSSSSKHNKRKTTDTKSDDDDCHRRRRLPNTEDGEVTGNPHVSGEHSKPILLPSNSFSSSNDSNFTNSSPAPADIISGDEFEALLFDDFTAPANWDYIPEIPQNKQEIQGISAASPEIPFEADVEFWNMLDGLNPFEEYKSGGDGSRENSSDQSSNLGEIENKKWLRYIENELGLEAAAVDGGHGGSAKGFDLEIPPEIQSDIGYYHLWPSL